MNEITKLKPSSEIEKDRCIKYLEAKIAQIREHGALNIGIAIVHDEDIVSYGCVSGSRSYTLRGALDELKSNITGSDGEFKDQTNPTEPTPIK